MGDSSTVNKYNNELPATQEQFPTEVPQKIHQPLAVVIDVSGSMSAVEKNLGQTESNVKLAQNLINQIGLDPDMKDEYKHSTDFLVMTFADNVEVQQDWIPLSRFARTVNLKAAGMTCFYDAVYQAVNACNVRRNSYKNTGTQCRRPQIFLFTDGYATDEKNAEKARALCKKYIDEERKATLHVILLPGSTPDGAKSLCDNVKLYKVEDCTNGLPASLKFINSSLVSFSSLTVGENSATTTLPPELKTTKDNAVVDTNGNRTTVNDTSMNDSDIWI